MNFNEMSVEQLHTRQSEIATEIDGLNTVDEVNARSAEFEAIKNELEARASAEAKKAEIRNAVANGAGEIIAEENEEEKENRNMFETNSKEYRNAWLANMMGKGITAEERAAITAASSVIPIITLNEVVEKVKKNPLLSKIDLMNIPGYVKIPVEDTIYGASWTSTSNDSADSLTYIQLNAYQLIKTVEVTADVEKMSIDAFESYLVNQLVRKIENALQKAVLVGAGATSSEPTGIYTTKSTATGYFTKAAITKKDLLGIMGKLDGQFQSNACWIMPASVFYVEVMGLSDHNSFATINDGFDMRLFGKPVVLDDDTIISSTDTILYGDPKHYRMNMGEGINVAKDDSVGFRSNSVCYRAVCLADGKLDLADSFVRYDRSAT